MCRTLLILVFTALAETASAQYAVQAAPGYRSLTLSLTWPNGAPDAVKLAPRGRAWGLKPQISNVRCGAKPLSHDSEGDWVAPPGCKVVTWQVVPDEYSPRGPLANEQRTLRVGKPGWVLLAEPTSLLRPIGDLGAGTLRSAHRSTRLTGATVVQPGEFRVPSSNSAPEFYVLGSPQTDRRTHGPFQVRYVADDAQATRRLGLESLHATALAYLLKVVNLPESTKAADRSLLVVWLGIAPSRAEAGGAAGSRSFIANYVAGRPERADRDTAQTLMIVAHEQFHQLVDIVHGSLQQPMAFPAWLSESLAQYYGLKAVRATDMSAAGSALWSRSIDAKRPVADGLLALHRRHQSGDESVYEAFYLQGATLWSALDELIADATHGEHGLDSYLGELLRTPIPPDGSLPESFVGRLRAVAGTGVDHLLAKYVGQ